MRVNVYAEEMTDRIEIITKNINGHEFTALRFWLELPASIRGSINSDEEYEPARVEDKLQARHVKAPFIHSPGDDDSSAVTFWGKQDLRAMLRVALEKLDEHYTEREVQRRIRVRDSQTSTVRPSAG